MSYSVPHVPNASDFQYIRCQICATVLYSIPSVPNMVGSAFFGVWRIESLFLVNKMSNTYAKIVNMIVGDMGTGGSRVPRSGQHSTTWRHPSETISLDAREKTVPEGVLGAQNNWSLSTQSS